MEKDALLEIVLHDLKEVETLMQSFKGKAELSPAFFKLTRRKMQSILEEIDMLEELADMPSNASSSSEGRERIAEIMESAKEDATPGPKEQTEETSKPSPAKEADTRKSGIEESPGKTEPSTEAAKEETPPPAQQEPAKERPQKEEEPASPAPDQPSGETYPPASKEKEAESASEPEQEVHSAPKKEHQVLGERLKTGKFSYNEQIAQKATNGASRRLFNKPVSDLRKALGINDRFFFQRELFGGSAGLMNETLDQLNEMNNMEDARNFLLTNFNWDPDNESVISFMNFVERRFL